MDIIYPREKLMPSAVSRSDSENTLHIVESTVNNDTVEQAL